MRGKGSQAMEQPWRGRAAHAGDAAQQHCPATARDGAELQCHCKHPALHSWKSDEDALMAPRSPRAQCGSRQVRKAGITSDERHGGLMMNVANLTHVRSANHREAAAAEHITQNISSLSHLWPIKDCSLSSIFIKILSILWKLPWSGGLLPLPWRKNSQFWTFSLIFSAICFLAEFLSLPSLLWEDSLPSLW